MPGSSGDKLCPICDSPLQPGSKKCGFCGTDLSIFDIDLGKEEAPEPVQPAPKPSIDQRVREVMAPSKPGPEPQPAPEPVAEPITEAEPESEITTALPAEEEPVLAEEKVVPEPEVVRARPEEVAEKAPEFFSCPECGTQVHTSAKSCPGCGGIFADEGTEMFQCPACDTLVNVDATNCPGCGAMFVESEDEAARTRAAPAQEMERPVSEVPTPTPPMREVKDELPETISVAPAAELEQMPEKEEEVKKAKSPFGWFRKRKKGEPEAAPEATAEITSEPEPVRRIPEPELIQPRAPPVRVSEAPPAVTPEQKAELKDKGKVLARMVAEMKPLLALAMEKEIEIEESKQLIDDAASAGRDRQLERALSLVNKARAILMGEIDEHLTNTVSQLKDEIRVAKELGGDVSRASTYINEVERARQVGDVEASFVYSEKVAKELQPITGRYNESKRKLATIRSLISDCEMLILDTKSARASLMEANKAFEARDFDRVDTIVKQVNDRLQRDIPERLTEEIKNARNQLVEAKMKNVNIAPMITVLKTVTSLAKAKDYSQALRELRQFKELVRQST